ERNNSAGDNNSTRQQERTTQLGSRNETTQLCTAVDRLQLPETAVDRLQPPTTACNRLQPPAPPAPPLQQNRLFLPTSDDTQVSKVRKRTPHWKLHDRRKNRKTALHQL
ncbi:hypothetical protein TNCV_1851831, partial [Trichonephila clavipes]